MELPQSWRHELEVGGVLLLFSLCHLLVVGCIVAEVWLWGFLPTGDPALAFGAKVATFAMVTVLVLADFRLGVRLISGSLR